MASADFEYSLDINTSAAEKTLSTFRKLLDNIKPVPLSVDVDTSTAQKGLVNLQSALKGLTVKVPVKDAIAQLNAEFVKTSATAKKSNDEIKQALALLIANGQKGSQAFNELQNELKQSTTEALKYQKALEEASEIEISFDPSQQKSGLEKFKGNLEAGFGNIGASIAGLLTPMGAATAGVAVLGAAFTKSIEAGAEFEKNLNAVGAITGQSGDDLDKLGNSALELSKRFGGDVNAQIGAFQGILSRFGAELAKSPDALNKLTENVNLLAKAGGLDAAQSMDALTNSMLQFGVNVEDPNEVMQESTRFINALAASAKVGAAEIPQVAEAITVAGVAAKQANVGFEETNAAIQVLAAGGKVGAEAGTALRNVLGKIAGEEVIPNEALDKLKSLGVDMNKVSDTTIPLSERLKELGKASKDATAFAQVFGTENAAAASILANGADTIADWTKEITGTQEATIQAEKNMQGFTEAMSRLTANINAFFIGLYTSIAPVISGIVDLLSGFFTEVLPFLGEVFKSVFDSFKPALEGLYKAIEPLIEAIQSLFASFGSSDNKALIEGLRTAITYLIQAAFVPLRIAIFAVTKVIQVLSAYYSTLINLFISAYKNSELFRTAIDGIVNAFKAMFSTISSIVTKVLEFLGILQADDKKAPPLKKTQDALVKTGEVAKQVASDIEKYMQQIQSATDKESLLSIKSKIEADTSISATDKAKLQAAINDRLKGLSGGKVSVGAKFSPNQEFIDSINKYVADIKKKIDGIAFNNVKITAVQDIEALETYKNEVEKNEELAQSERLRIILETEKQITALKIQNDKLEKDESLKNEIANINEVEKEKLASVKKELADKKITAEQAKKLETDIINENAKLRTSLTEKSQSDLQKSRLDFENKYNKLATDLQKKRAEALKNEDFTSQLSGLGTLAEQERLLAEKELNEKLANDLAQNKNNLAKITSLYEAYYINLGKLRQDYDAKNKTLIETGISTALDTLNKSLSTISIFPDKTQTEAELNNIKRSYNEQQNALKASLATNEISYEEYNKRKAELEKQNQEELKKLQLTFNPYSGINQILAQTFASVQNVIKANNDKLLEEQRLNNLTKIGLEEERIKATEELSNAEFEFKLRENELILAIEDAKNQGLIEQETQLQEDLLLIRTDYSNKTAQLNDKLIQNRTKQDDAAKKSQELQEKILNNSIANIAAAGVTALAEGKNVAKAMIGVAFDFLQAMVPIWSAQIVGGSLATPQSILSGGIAGVAQAAAITALLLAAVQAAKQSILAFKDGGAIPQGERIIRVNEEGQEFVINARATRKHKSLLEALNAGKNPYEVLKSDKQFNSVVLENQHSKEQLRELQKQNNELKTTNKLLSRNVELLEKTKMVDYHAHYNITNNMSAIKQANLSSYRG